MTPLERILYREDPSTGFPLNYEASARIRARETFSSDECQIDDDAKVSEADSGVWVAAWLWLPDEEDGSR